MPIPPSKRSYRRAAPGHANADVEALLWYPHVGPKTTEALRRSGVTTLGELSKLSADDLCALPGIGEKKLASIRNALRELRFTLRGDEG